MRFLILSLALLASAPLLSACTSNPSSPAIQALDNPANSCGEGGSSNINDCNYGRR